MHEPALNHYLGPRGERPDSNYYGIVGINWRRLDFTDAHGRWAVTLGGGPEPIDQVDVTDFDLEGSLMLSDLRYLRDSEGWVVEEPASDCGSG